MNPLKPLLVALAGKGTANLVKRVFTLARRYSWGTSGMRRALSVLHETLQHFGCPATLPITAVAMARHSEMIRAYQTQATEFAVHGYRHVDYTALSPEEQLLHLDRATHLFRTHGIRVTGFRSPYLRWNNDTLAALVRHGIEYDSSASLVLDVPERHQTDGYLRGLRFYGAQRWEDCPALPYLDKAELVRIPYCLPDDESLVERLKWQTSEEMNQIWPAMFRQIHEQGELFTLGLHPERARDCLKALTLTLQEIEAAEEGVWCARLGEIAAWWKARYHSRVTATPLQEGVLQISVEGPEGTVILLRSVEAKTAVVHWAGGYDLAREVPCIVRSPRRPFVGVAPDVEPSMLSFLRQQGYIVEECGSREPYSVYVDHRRLAHADKRALVAEIEGSGVPLVRLGRWPQGVRSAVAITGDIDGLSLWDYGSRFFER